MRCGFDTALVNLLSPVTVITWLVIAPGYFGHGSQIRSVLAAAGVFAGVAAWFLIEASVFSQLVHSDRIRARFFRYSSLALLVLGTLTALVYAVNYS